MKQMNWEESEGCNRFIKNITAGILEYVLEVGIDEAVKGCVKDNPLLDKCPHLESYAKEHGFI